MSRSAKIVQIIENNPGIRFREIMRETGMKNGVLNYYARKLEQIGNIRVERSPRITRFYPLGIQGKESILIKNLRQETPKNILVSLLENEILTFNKIVENVKRSPSTVSIYLSQLVNDEIVESKYVEQKRIFQIKNKELVQKTISKYHPNLFERSADHIADIFSSL